MNEIITKLFNNRFPIVLTKQYCATVVIISHVSSTFLSGVGKQQQYY